MSSWTIAIETVAQNRYTKTPVYALLVANVISLVGSAVSAIAIPWFVLQPTGSASKTGLIGFFVVLPHFLVGVLGGTFVDRFGYKRISVVADVVSGVSIGLIPLLYETVGLEFWQLSPLVFAGALLTIPGLTARRSLLPGAIGGQINLLLVTVRHERIPAELRGRVFSTFSASSTAAAPPGMLSFGLIIERWGLNPAVLLAELGYFIIGVALIFSPAVKEMDRRLPESSPAAAS